MLHSIHIAGAAGHTSFEHVRHDADSLHIEDAGGGPSVFIPAVWFQARTQALDARPHAIRATGLVITVRSMPAIPVEP
jgi:hypothetical protein